MPKVTKLRGFKPQFGNEHHIKIIEEISKLNKNIEKRDEYLKQRKESRLIKLKIAEQKTKIRRMIDFSNQQKTG